jgi:monoamine oxidase
MRETAAEGRATDMIVIGAGAAGLAASARLRGLGVSHCVLEARGRVGGRAHTVMVDGGLAIDLGCGWLHSAKQNAWTRIAECAGVEIDRSPPPWSRPALDLNFPMELQRDYRRAFEALETRLEVLAEQAGDAPASSAIRPEDARWRPLFDAFSGYYNGAAFDDISIKDYAAYQPTEDNWRLPSGYGALMAQFGADLPIQLDTPVTRIEHGGARLKVVTPEGAMEARAVILAVPTTVLARGALAFDPPLPDKLEAAAALPLGHVNKVFLHLNEAPEFAADALVYGRTDSQDTGSYTLRPMGRPMIEGFFGGEIAGRLESEPGGLGDFAINELCAVFGSSFRTRIRFHCESAWGADPWSQGAYSHARPGYAGMRAVLAAPVDGRLFFAGEACSPHAFSTAHGAYETGVAAADSAVAALNG